MTLHRLRLSESLVAFACLGLSLLPANAFSEPEAKSGGSVVSPDEYVTFHLLNQDGGRLHYQVNLDAKAAIEPSKLGIRVDGIDLGQGVAIEGVDHYEIDEEYPWRGVHSTAVNRCRGAKFRLHHQESGTRYFLEVRAFDDGIAFRFLVPGSGTKTPDAATEFRIPEGSTVWYHGLRGHYEGVHTEKPIESVSVDEWLAPPLTIKLPDDAGYAAVTEGALLNYSGMALQAGGNRTLRERLGHDQPIGHPFELRFGKEQGERLSHAAAVDGDIITPWRIVMLGKDLGTLVNCDIVHNVAPIADRKFFPQGMQTDWIKPGRSVWKFLDGGENTLQEMMNFSRWAGELGFEYNLIEGHWQRWSRRELRSLVEYSGDYDVKIWLWKDSRDLRTPKSREDFFSLCSDVGVVGVKIDFLDHEAKEVIDLYHELLRGAARHQLMVNFHGSNKPSGEARMWPHEMTREGVRGLEARQVDSRSRHNATLPFTRYLAGHGDYTPVVFGQRRGDTSAAHQIATAAIFTSPLLVYGGHPKSLLDHPAAEMIKSIPAVWDETVVLPGSHVGQVAAFARRNGEDWFLAVLSGADGRKLRIPLSFLSPGKHRALLVRDVQGDPAAVNLEHRNLTSSEILEVNLVDGGGYIGRFSRAEPRLHKK